MRLSIQCGLILSAALLGGCASSEPKFTEVPGVTTGAKAPADPVVVKTDEVLTGRVVSANARGRFAILNFPITRMPAVGDVLQVYRSGLKVGEVKISGPQKDDSIVADVVTGEAKTGDEVRAR